MLVTNIALDGHMLTRVCEVQIKSLLVLKLNLTVDTSAAFGTVFLYMLE